MSQAIEITTANFDAEVLQSQTPVLVDYWAQWCGPCRQLSPVIDQIAADREGSLKVAKVNIDEQPELAQRAGVRSIPYLVLYKDGEAAAEAIGAQPKAALEQTLGLTA